MIKNLPEFFLPEQQFYLHKLFYDRIETSTEKENYSLKCTDNISVELGEHDNVRVIVTRSLFFVPEGLFRLSVAFGADIKFDSQKKGEHKWEEVNLAEEFRDYGDFVTINLINRISLMISQITSSFGQMPLITYPSIAKNNNFEEDE